MMSMAALAAAAVLPADRALAAIWTPDNVKVSETDDVALTTLSGHCAVVLPDGAVYAVWYERTGNRSSEIRGAERGPGGEWLERNFRISEGDSLSRNPTAAATDDGEVHVVWEDTRHGSGEEIYYRHRSTEGTWSPEERLTASDFPSTSPVVSMGPGNRMHLVWSDGAPGNFEIFHRYRDEDGTWSTPLRLTDHAGRSLMPVIAVEPTGIVHVAWQDNVHTPVPGEDPNNTEIYHIMLSDDGTPFGVPDRVCNSLGASRNPAMALGPDGALHVFWSDNRDRSPVSTSYFPYAIWYRRWLPDLGFGHEKRFVFSSSDHIYPAVAVSPDGTVNVVWEDFVHGNSEIYFRQIRLESGWEPELRLTQTVGPTRNPTILADPDGDLHLVWADTEAGEESSVRYRLGKVTSTTPVVLAGWDAEWQGEELALHWSTSSEVDHAGFVIQGVDDLDSEPATLLPGVIGGGPEYRVTLSAAALGERRILKLVALSRSGALETVAVIPVPEPGGASPPAAFLRNPHPNPARGSFQVPVVTDGNTPLLLELLDVSGRRVARFDAGIPAGGVSAVTVSEEALGGTASGRYWIRLLAGGRPSGKPLPITIAR